MRALALKARLLLKQHLATGIAASMRSRLVKVQS